MTRRHSTAVVGHIYRVSLSFMFRATKDEAKEKGEGKGKRQGASTCLGDTGIMRCSFVWPRIALSRGDGACFDSIQLLFA